MSLKLEVGRHYKTRSGNETFLVLSVDETGYQPVKARCVYTGFFSDGYFCEDEVACFWNNGRYPQNTLVPESPYDLVAIDYDF